MDFNVYLPTGRMIGNEMIEFLKKSLTRNTMMRGVTCRL